MRQVERLSCPYLRDVRRFFTVARSQPRRLIDLLRCLLFFLSFAFICLPNYPTWSEPALCDVTLRPRGWQVSFLSPFIFATEPSIMTTHTGSPETSCQVRVGVRVRPLTSTELSSGGNAVVDARPIERTVSVAGRKFTYDAVFDDQMTQTDLYRTVSPSLLGSFLDGYNATIMAYGQTGSGKTYTMGSEAHGSSGDIADGADGDGEGEGLHIGLIPRFMADMFAALEEQKRRAASEAAAAAVSPSKKDGDRSKKNDKSSSGDGSGDGSASSSSSKLVHYDVSASFLEVYGEDVHDLLDEDRKTLPLREDGTGSVSVVGLKTRSVSTASEALNVLHVGTLHRTTAATLMNHQSSRSHAVFTVHLQQTMRNEESGVDVTTSSRFTFVDLAGSERMKKTGAEGERAREGIKINEGLLALGNVINALADEERLAKGGKVQHVPYRQSKLTRLLQDALGGNSQTLFLACVSPSDGNAPETLSTLHYANRARNIKNAPTKNVDATMLEVQRLHALTYVLQNELVKQMFQDDASASSPSALSTSSSTSSSSSSSTSSRGKSSRIGQAKAELYERKEVKEYMEKIRRAAEEKQQNSSGGMQSSSFSLVASGGPSTSNVSAPARNDTKFASSSMALPLPTSHRPRAGSRDFAVSNNMGGRTTTGEVGGPSEQLLDAAFLADVDPDGDMAILDQLIEIQHQDQEFDKAQKEDQVQIDQVEGQIEEQELLLLQLKESMKVYHDMKDKYEALMGEVQSLEAEKISLARELERVQVDPTKGCSIAIKKKLEKVESSLVRARSETRKHQQMYRKAEAEAQKCRVLERKISDLKQGKVALMKKQREAAARHRTFMDAKTREIHTLKKKERKVGQKVSKLEAECHKYKTNLERRKQYCDKLQDKLKQTESHLMSLLSMRKRELQKRTKSLAPSAGLPYRSRGGDGGVGGRGANAMTDTANTNSDNGSDPFAERTEEVKSIKFLLEKMVSDRVVFSQNKTRYEKKVAEYSNLMKMLTVELQAIKAARQDTKSSTEEIGDLDEQSIQSLRHHEHNINDLELKLDLVGAELEDLRAKLPRGEFEDRNIEGVDPTCDEDLVVGETSGLTRSEDSATRMMSNLSAPVLRTILWDMLDAFTKSELERLSLAEILKRKESALRGFEAEVNFLNDKVVSLSSEIGERRRMSAANGESDALELMRQKDDEIKQLRQEVEQCTRAKDRAELSARETNATLEKAQVDLCVSKEKLTVAEVALKRSGGAKEAEETLVSLQAIWGEVGVAVQDRETSRIRIDRCLENTCSRLLDDANQTRGQILVDIAHQRQRLLDIYQALGLADIAVNFEASIVAGAADSDTSNGTLMQRLGALNEKMDHIMPTYAGALERRSTLASEASSLIKALHPLNEDKISDNIKSMIKSKRAGEKRRRVQMPAESTPAVKFAKKRREDMFRNVEGMVRALEGENSDAISGDPMQIDGEDQNHQLDNFKTAAADEPLPPIEAPRSLSESFLDKCENDIKQLRLMKTELLVSNGDSRSQTQLLAKEMHLRARDVVSLVVHSTKKQRRDFPSWWDPKIVDDVCHIVTSKDAVVRADGSFTKHLDFVRQCLKSVASGRRALSQTLKSVVERAYKTLLTAVDGETYASEAYNSFHDALFRLPPLSKEHIRACIDEMETLITAVEAMSQSEIEALTVVWDAVSITSSERGTFWSDVEEAVASVQAQGDGPFGDIFKTSGADLEDWVRSSAVDAKKVYRHLNTRLFKLGKIHEEVEAQRSKQDAKSKIISLDSEVRILSTKLSDFEEKASSKQRLLTKKMNSTALLKEEKFRKQMQSKFAAKLEALGRLLQDWEQTEGKSFDASLLSDDVRTLLSNPDKSGTWIEQRTAFMHLRTAHQKHGSRRRGESPAAFDSVSSSDKELPGMKHLQRPTSSSRARVAASPGRKARPATTSRTTMARRDPSPATRRDAPPAQTRPIGASLGVATARSNKMGASSSVASSRPTSSRVANNSSSSSRSRNGISTAVGPATSVASSQKRHIEPTARLPIKKQHLSPDEEVGVKKERVKRAPVGKKGLSSTRTSTNDAPPDSPPSSRASGTKSLAVDTTRTTTSTTANPFGALLSKTPTPKHTTKENRPW